MLTLDSDTGELQDHISVHDQGVDQATNMWLEFDEDLVVYNKDPAIVSLSVIIEDNLQKLTSPIADAQTLPIYLLILLFQLLDLQFRP